MTDNEKLDLLIDKMVVMESGIKDLSEKVVSLDYNMRDMRLTLENETNRNIQLIAEGHRVLNRKLDEALKVEQEKEYALIRLNILENEVRRLKERIEQMA